MRLRDLANLSASDRKLVLKELIDATKTSPDSYIRELNDQIKALEVTYKFSSEEMKHQLANGDPEETNDICNWLMLIKLRDRLIQI